MSLSLFLGFVCFAIAIAAIVVAVISTPSYARKRFRRKHEFGRKVKAPKSLVTSQDELSRAELRLSSYLFFDAKQAARLVDGVQARYPDMPRQWCAEKALTELERDRKIK
jgi:hypothetical protein